jgi:hypothetical protein
VNIQWTFSEHSVNIQWTYSERLVNIQWTFSEHSVPVRRRSAGAPNLAACNIEWAPQVCFLMGTAFVQTCTEARTIIRRENKIIIISVDVVFPTVIIDVVSVKRFPKSVNDFLFKGFLIVGRAPVIWYQYMDNSYPLWIGSTETVIIC